MFAHEDAEAHRLRRIPLCVRRKLTEVESELDDLQWRRLPKAARTRLVELEAGTDSELEGYRSLVGWLKTTFVHAPPDRRRSTADPRPAWPWRRSHPPVSLAHRLERHGLRWQELGIDARFALLEATRSGDETHLERALRAVSADRRAPGE